MYSQKHFHYTSIDTLEKILKSRKLRFNRVDNLDDPDEEDIIKVRGVNLSYYIFISCWTWMSEESIPQWNMYTPESKGVRIGINPMPFVFYDPDGPDSLLVKSAGSEKSILPWSEIYNDKYTVINSYVKSGDIFYNVEYVPDPFAATLESQPNLRAPSPGEKVELNVNLSDVAKYKSTHWMFQEECRYKILVLPYEVDILRRSSYNMKRNPNFADELHQRITLGANMMANSMPPGVLHIDIPMSYADMADMDVTLGPKCSPSDRDRVDSMLREFGAHRSSAPSAIRLR